MLTHLPSVAFALLPVLLFLAALITLDGYKLLSLTAVLGAIGAGVLIAGASYPVNAFLLRQLGIDIASLSRYVAPLSEELLKGLVIVALVRAHRVGFLVDAAIFGFAIGSGFALAENTYYLVLASAAEPGTWIVRGFGTALMHGGTTALFAVMGLLRVERSGKIEAAAFMPGFVLAALVHAGFNHLNFAPLLATLTTLFTVPALLMLVFQRSEGALRDWLGQGFDADVALIELIDSDRFADSPPGRYLASLKGGLSGPLAVDASRYVRLYTELALRAKGILMMRENGFEPRPLDDATRTRFAELRQLESKIGPAVQKALRPLLKMRHRELWQLYMLEDGTG